MTLPSIPQFDEIFIYPYNSSEFINDYNWKITMQLWCGFEPETLTSFDYMQMPEVMQMPNYPDEGSIKVIDGTVIVKFAD